MSQDIPEEITSTGPARIQKELLDVNPYWQDDLLEEMAQSITQGPILQPLSTLQGVNEKLVKFANVIFLF